MTGCIIVKKAEQLKIKQNEKQRIILKINTCHQILLNRSKVIDPQVAVIIKF